MLYLFLILLKTIEAIDFYQILDVTPDATEDEIKKSFRKLSRQYHPDKNRGDPEAEQKYLDVTKAYEVLSDPKQKQIYDIYGEDAVNDPSYLNRRKGPSYRFDLEVELEDVYNGLKKETTFRRNELCKSCKGTGAKDKRTIACKSCGGKGTRLQNLGFIQMQTQCERCGGRGFMAAERCPKCNGQKVQNAMKTLKVQIEQGMDNGSEIVFEGESEQHPDFFPGDIIFVLKVKSHPRFTRERHNLHTTVELSLKEALLGYKKQIAHLDGHVVQIEYTGITQPQSVRRVVGEGMPHHDLPSTKGDLLVKFQVNLPRKLTPEQEEQVRQLFSQ